MYKDQYGFILFPGDRSHQKVFLSIFIELKYAPLENSEKKYLIKITIMDSIPF